jgi:hypothetical protein
VPIHLLGTMRLLVGSSHRLVKTKENTVSTLEEEFTEIVSNHKAEIEAKVSEARHALSEAVELSEKYGIPFRPPISFLRNSYYPRSFNAKFGALDEETVSELTGAWRSYYAEDAGWKHSAVC